MGNKCKLKQFEEYRSFNHTFEKDCTLKGKWKEHFRNNNPIVLELACGKGDYAIGLANLYPNKNFIGIDIKGNRMWRGANTVEEKGILNVAFLRAHIDHITDYFTEGEVDEIWITFPDPQPKKERKRLTSKMFLDRYKPILKSSGTINLKCDSELMYEYTLQMIEENNLALLINKPDVYLEENVSQEMEIKTYYERKWLKEGRVIKYLKFSL